MKHAPFSLFRVSAAALWRRKGASLLLLRLSALGVFSAALLQNLALRRLSAAAVALLQATQPIMTTAASWLLLGERLNFYGMAGAAMIIICIAAEAFTANKAAKIPDRPSKIF